MTFQVGFAWLSICSESHNSLVALKHLCWKQHRDFQFYVQPMVGQTSEANHQYYSLRLWVSWASQSLPTDNQPSSDPTKSNRLMTPALFIGGAVCINLIDFASAFSLLTRTMDFSTGISTLGQCVRCVPVLRPCTLTAAGLWWNVRAIRRKMGAVLRLRVALGLVGEAPNLIIQKEKKWLFALPTKLQLQKGIDE